MGALPASHVVFQSTTVDSAVHPVVFPCRAYSGHPYSQSWQRCYAGKKLLQVMVLLFMPFVDVNTCAVLLCERSPNYRQVLLENAQRGSAPSAGVDVSSTLPRVPGVPATLPLVSIPSKKIEEIYLQVRSHGSVKVSDGCLIPASLQIWSLATRMHSMAYIVRAQSKLLTRHMLTHVGDSRRRVSGRRGPTTGARCRGRPASSTSCPRPRTRRRAPPSAARRSSRRRRYALGLRCERQKQPSDRHCANVVVLLSPGLPTYPASWLWSPQPGCRRDAAKAWSMRLRCCNILSSASEAA